MRNEPNAILESNFFEWRKSDRKDVEDLLHIFEHLRSVLPHLFGPGQLFVLEHRLENKQWTIQPERFPPLRQRPTRFTSFDDHRGVAEKGHAVRLRRGKFERSVG